MGCRLAVGDEVEYGEWRFSRRSASETRTESGAGAALKLVFSGGGGILFESNAKKGAAA